MSSPPIPYVRQFDFTDYATDNPGQPLPGIDVDNELNAILATLNANLTRLNLIQRADGALANLSVGPDQLNSAALFAAAAALGTADNATALAAQSAAQLVNNFSTLAGRNRIINGDMRIDQRNAGASVALGAGVVYTLDRWGFGHSQPNKLTAGQNYAGAAPPAGVSANYLGVKATAAYASLAADFFGLYQVIESVNILDLGFGAAGAQPVSLSFWVYASQPGIYGGAIQNYQENRSYPFSFAINNANTWTKVVLTIPGDTVGTWASMYVLFDLGSGANFKAAPGAWGAGNIFGANTETVSLVGTLNAVFAVTDVQLEIAPPGATPAAPLATPFERRDYASELARCQRYYQNLGGQYVNQRVALGYCQTASIASFTIQTFMRAAPTVSFNAPVALYDGTNTTPVTGVGVTAQPGPINISATVAGGLTVFRPVELMTNNSLSGAVILNAEL